MTTDFSQATSREERLTRLRKMQESLAQINTGFQSDVLTLDVGVTTVRILPPVGDMDEMFFHSPVGYHMIGDTVARCSEFTSGNQIKCPICEVTEVLRRSGKAGKDLASKIRLNKKYWMNVIVRGADDQFNTATGPLILKAGVTIFNAARSFVMDPDYGVIDDPEHGIDLKIEKKGSGINTEYSITPRRGSKQPLLSLPDGSVDWEGVQALMGKVQDLSPVLMPDDPEEDEAYLSELDYTPAVRVYSFDRTVMQFGVCLETLPQLEEIIAKNVRDGNGRGEGDDGRAAQPVRGSGGNSGQRAAGSGRGDIGAVQDRIAALRGGSKR